jgi:excisionase family DNA binding protein
MSTPGWLSTADVADALGLTPRRVRLLIAQKRLRARQAGKGGRMWISRADVDAARGRHGRIARGLRLSAKPDRRRQDWVAVAANIDRWLVSPVQFWRPTDALDFLRLRANPAERLRFAGSIIDVAKRIPPDDPDIRARLQEAIGNALASPSSTPGPAGNLIRRTENRRPGTAVGIAMLLASWCEPA